MHARPVVPGLPALVLAALIGTMAMMSFVAVIGPVVRLLGLSEWHAGLSVTAAGVLWMLAARPWGQLSDRIGRKRVLMLAMSAYTVVYIALAVFIDVALQTVPPVLVSVLVLVGARGLIGLFYAAVPPTAAALIADKAPTGQRARFLARLGSANALGMVLGPAAAGWLAYTNLSLALYVAALLPLLALALLAWRLPATPPVLGASAQRRAPMSRLDPRLRLPQLAAFIAMVSVTIAQVTVGFFAIDRLGLDAAAGARMAGIALTAVGVGLILAQALVHSDHFLGQRGKKASRQAFLLGQQGFQVQAELVCLDLQLLEFTAIALNIELRCIYAIERVFFVVPAINRCDHGVGGFDFIAQAVQVVLD